MIAAFGIGTTEFVVMGLLPGVAADLGVSVLRTALVVAVDLLDAQPQPATA